jgi:tetratricopeptide (TPR) repeat protein
MRDLWENGLLMRILAVVVLTILLGVAPLPHIVETGFFRAGRAQASGAHLETARNLALVAEHLPWRSDLWEPAGREALQGGDPELAITCFKQAAAAGALSQTGYLRFGEAYQAAGNPYSARQVWQAANHIFGPSLDALARIAGLQRAAKDYPALIETLKQSYQLTLPASPSMTKLNLELGMLLAAVDPASAPPYLLQAAGNGPDQTEARELAFAIQRALPNDNPLYTRMAAGRKLASLGYWELAAYAFQAVTEAQPDYAEGWAYLGEALQHLEAPNEGALEALEQAYALDPASLPANALLAVYWRRQGQPERAYRYLLAAERLDPGNPDLLVDLGAAAAVLGDLEKGLAYLQAAIQASHNDPYYLRSLVAFCIDYNYDLSGVALPTARQALLADPYQPASLDTMAQVLLRLGDVLNAQRFLLRALALDPEYAPAHLHLGLVHRLQGQEAQARVAFLQAIALSPDTPTADLANRFLDESNPP